MWVETSLGGPNSRIVSLLGVKFWMVLYRLIHSSLRGSNRLVDDAAGVRRYGVTQNILIYTTCPRLIARWFLSVHVNHRRFCSNSNGSNLEKK